MDCKKGCKGESLAKEKKKTSRKKKGFIAEKSISVLKIYDSVVLITEKLTSNA